VLESKDDPPADDKGKGPAQDAALPIPYECGTYGRSRKPKFR
jgi:hypothetical protein